MVSSNGLAYGVLDATQWQELVTFVGSTASLPLLGTAMAAVGLKTSLSALQGVGPKPFILGLVGSTVVGLTGFVSISVLTTMVA